jgi:hypothetical protein
MKVQDNYMDLLEHFKVEELKERLEFDMAAEAAGWDKKAKPTAKGGGFIYFKWTKNQRRSWCKRYSSPMGLVISK